MPVDTLRAVYGRFSGYRLFAGKICREGERPAGEEKRAGKSRWITAVNDLTQLVSIMHIKSSSILLVASGMRLVVSRRIPASTPATTLSNIRQNFGNKTFNAHSA